MNKFLPALAIVPLLIATPALAADPFEPLPPGIVEVDENPWEGGYIGVQGGFARATREGCYDSDAWFEDGGIPNVDCDFVDGWADGEFGPYTQEGWLVGAQAGVNIILGDFFLLGAEGDVSLASISGELEPDFTQGDDPWDISAGGFGTWNYLATGTLQAGIAIDAFKLYAEGGIAIGGFQWDGNTGCDFNTNIRGLVAGVGAAVMVTDNVSIGAEYNHIWFDDDINNCTTGPFLLLGGNVNSQIQTSSTMDVVKLNANMHF